MSKLLFCLPRFHTNLIPWVRVLQQAGHEVDIHVLRYGGSEDHRLVAPSLIAPSEWTQHARSCLKARADADYYAAPEWREYWALLKRSNPDVVIVRGVSRWFCRMAALEARLQGRHVVVYDQEDPDPPRFSSTWIRRFATRQAGFGCVTARMAQPGNSTRSAAFAETLPFGSVRNSERMEKEARERIVRPTGTIRILMVGKYRRRKGHMELLTALQRLADTYSFQVTFCGEEVTDGDRLFRQRLQDLANQSGLGERLRFRHGLSMDQMMGLYSEHHLFVLPSTNEPAAVSPMEAAWNGCAVLVDQDSGTRFYLPDDARFACDAKDPDSIVRSLEPFLADPLTLRRGRLACLQRIVQVAGDGAVMEAFNRAVLPTRL